MTIPLVLDSVRARVAILYAASSLPLLMIALLLAWHSEHFVRNGFVVCAAFVVGLAVVGTLASGAVVRPLRGLQQAVEIWPYDGTFHAARAALMPVEIADLSAALARAAKTLSEQEKEQLRLAAAQHDQLMQEIHHRVKNNLQIVASLLNLQANRIGLPEVRAEFQSARDRVRALATLHRHLYAEGDLNSINMRSFLVELCGQMLESSGERKDGRIALAIEAPELSMSSDQAVPLSLIVTEVVSNAIKYAFPGHRPGNIRIRVVTDEHVAHLSIEDDGVGMGGDASAPNEEMPEGLGLQLIRGFAKQLGATLSISRGEGTRYELAIPLRRDRVDAAA